MVSRSSDEQKSPSSIHYLPSHQEAEREISKIKSAKGLDEQQAKIEFLARYVPEIKWWEINSLSELDEKIALVNSRTGFPPFKVVPKVSEFNEEFEKNLQYKSLLFFASIVPRQADGAPDWKGIKDFMVYLTTVLKPLLDPVKFKPSFANLTNLQELGDRIISKVNTQLVSICSGFSSLSSVDKLNELTNNYSSKIFQGYIYSEIEDSLAEELAITSHHKYEVKLTGNHSENTGWKIALNEIAFSQDT